MVCSSRHEADLQAMSVSAVLFLPFLAALTCNISFLIHTRLPFADERRQSEVWILCVFVPVVVQTVFLLQ